MIRGSNFLQDQAPGQPPAGPDDNQPVWKNTTIKKPPPTISQEPQGDPNVVPTDYIGGGA